MIEYTWKVTDPETGETWTVGNVLLNDIQIQLAEVMGISLPDTLPTSATDSRYYDIRDQVKEFLVKNKFFRKCTRCGGGGRVGLHTAKLGDICLGCGGSGKMVRTYTKKLVRDVEKFVKEKGSK